MHTHTHTSHILGCDVEAEEVGGREEGENIKYIYLFGKLTLEMFCVLTVDTPLELLFHHEIMNSFHCWVYLWVYKIMNDPWL